MSYTGPLMEIKKLNSSVYDELPLAWIAEKSYKSTPNQRLDTSKSSMDMTGVLHREVLSHTRSKIEFELRANTNVGIAQFNAFMSEHYTNSAQRRFYLRYYDQETDGYKTGEFYMPDPTYNIKNIDYANKVIRYNTVRIAFIEY